VESFRATVIVCAPASLLAEHAGAQTTLDPESK
jgi:hypothetical protein